MSRRILILGLAIGCLGIGFAGGYVIRGLHKPVMEGTRTPLRGPVTIVPDIVGLDLDSALQRLQAAGLGARVTAFRMRERPRGIVVAQAPAHSIAVTKGTAIGVDVSAGDSLEPVGVAHCALRPPEAPGSPPCFGGIALIDVKD
jgi:hypothetical protein